MMPVYALMLLWMVVVLSLWLLKGDLIRNTWRERYICEQLLLIESDDWGPGGDFHAERLDRLAEALAAFKDSQGRPAVMTGNMVLTVPNLNLSLSSGSPTLIRSRLDKEFPIVYKSVRDAMTRGVFVPQLHGIEHLYGEGLLQLARSGDPRVRHAAETASWWDWEALDPPLQGHYVNGGSLPTKPLDSSTQQALVGQAAVLFKEMFGFAITSTVAPCYLWMDATEQAWVQQNIWVIQSAGYRCLGRREDGSYVQDKREIRPGYRNELGQVFLVRNAMYEPVDGRKHDDCIRQIEQAFRQNIPASISTHRYNYTRTESEFTQSVGGLRKILTYCTTRYKYLRFASSPELGQWYLSGAPMKNPADESQWPALKVLTGMQKVSPFLFRLWYRHQKIRLIASLTGLVIPGWLFVQLCSQARGAGTKSC